jgi:large subunit ribosomal protein L35
MPKIKTRQAAAKRFTPTGGGSFKRACAFKNHKLNGKTRKTKRNLRHGDYVSEQEAKVVKKMLPYS